jgi:hypothetical protein
MRHPDLGSALMQLFPQADPIRDFQVEDKGDGEGPTLSFWDEAKLGVQPTSKDIENAVQDFKRAQPHREMRVKVQAGIEPIDFMQAVLESKLGNEAPMKALLEKYQAFKDSSAMESERSPSAELP